MSTYSRYMLNVSSVDPPRGSMSGGVLLNIQGTGFGSHGNEVVVMVGNSSCLVHEVNMTTITCTTGQHLEGVVDVKVNCCFFILFLSFFILLKIILLLFAYYCLVIIHQSGYYNLLTSISGKETNKLDNNFLSSRYP